MFLDIILVIYYILFFVVLAYGLYFLFTGLVAFFPLKEKAKLEDKNYKFAIFIPARNEEEVIGDIIDSLKKQNYPKSLYDIFVIINNTTDKTEEVAKKAGAKVLNVDIPVKTKGEVLLWTKEKFRKTDYDAYLIFDADNVVHPGFIKAMNNALCRGSKVAQGFRDTKNLSDNWISTSYSLFYYIQNFFFHRARMRLNLSATINGTGFMAKKDFFEEVFDPKSLTEDVEFSALTVLHGDKVEFVEDALTYDEQVTDFKASWNQRKRWSKGMLQCLKLYRFPLLKKFFGKADFANLDLYCMFVSPIIQVLSFALAIVLIIFALAGVELFDLFSYLLAYNLLFLIVTYLLSVLLNIFIIRYNKRPIKDSLSGIFLFSVFIFTWIPINIACFFDKKVVWDPIKHNKKMANKDEIMKNS